MLTIKDDDAGNTLQLEVRNDTVYNMAEAAKFFEETNEPAGFKASCEDIQRFSNQHKENNVNVVLITVCQFIYIAKLCHVKCTSDYL